MRCQEIFPHAHSLGIERGVPVRSFYKIKFLLQIQHYPCCQGLQSGLTEQVKAILLTSCHMGIVWSRALLKHRAATAKGTQPSPTHVLAIWCSTAPEMPVSLITELQTCRKQMRCRPGLHAGPCGSLHVVFLCKYSWQRMEDLMPPNGASIPTTCYCQLSNCTAPLPPFFLQI